MQRTLPLLRLAGVLLARQALAPAQPLEKITINFPTRSAASWPIFIAKEDGYYQKYGLDANIVFGVHPVGSAMVVNGDAQMSNYSLETAMQATARDGSLGILGSWLNKAVFALMARKDFTSATEAIQRFYQDKDFAVKSYIAYDPQSRADVERFYDLHYKANLFECVLYVLSGAVNSVIAQQTDPPLITLMKGYDYRKVVDNSHVDQLVKSSFYEKLFGPGVKMEEDRKSKLAFR